MEKKFLTLLWAVLFTLTASAGSDSWRMWMSAYQGGAYHLPYNFASDFGKLKGGYVLCEMSVYEADIKFGEFAPKQDPYLTYSLYYDEKGRLSIYDRKDLSSDNYYGGSYVCRFTYDDTTGRLLKETYSAITNTEKKFPGRVFREIIYNYDSSKRLITIDRYNSNNNALEWRTKFVYGNGYVDRYEYNSSGALECKVRDTKDAKGRFSKYTEKSTLMGAPWTLTETVTYNEKGFVSKIDCRETLVVNGKTTPMKTNGNRYRKYEYRYDSFGNWTDRVMMWVRGNPGYEIYELVHCEYYTKEDITFE